VLLGEQECFFTKLLEDLFAIGSAWLMTLKTSTPSRSDEAELCASLMLSVCVPLLFSLTDTVSYHF
jgi:hypothetical protein